MACNEVVGKLVKQLQNCPGGEDAWCRGHKALLPTLARGESLRQQFLQAYPLRGNPARITSLTSTDVYSRGNDSFFRGIAWNLKELGFINSPGFPRAFSKAAGTHLVPFKKLLKIALNDRTTLAEKIDARWQEIPGFGGDKHIAKKIVATYYPGETLPIFATERMEFRAKLLGINIDAECKRKQGVHYADVGMTVGRKWGLLTELLLERKAHHRATAQQDNVFFMRVLEH